MGKSISWIPNTGQVILEAKRGIFVILYILGYFGIFGGQEDIWVILV